MGLLGGAPAPLFVAPSHVNPLFALQSLAGRYVLLAFLPEPGPQKDAALRLVEEHLACFRDDRKLFFGVLPDDASFNSVEATPPWRWFLDADGELRRLYEAVDAAGNLVPRWVVLDPSLRIMGVAPLDRGAEVLGHFAKFGRPEDHAGVPLNAPVLIVPRVFETEFCAQLIKAYEAEGGQPSGVMRGRDGKTYGVLDDFKRRHDATISDPALVAQMRLRIKSRLLPQVEKAFGFTATRIERYIVARYSAEDGGYFRPHIDNGAPGTAHRKFAASINLNAEDYEGGELRFPEFGVRTYKPPTGGAVVFSCSLLHEATAVTRGVRYVSLPFFYDEEGERLRTANLHTFEPTS